MPNLWHSWGTMRIKLNLLPGNLAGILRGLAFIGLLAGPVSSLIGKEPSSPVKETAAAAAAHTANKNSGQAEENISFSEKKLLAVVAKQEELLARYSVKKELSQYDMEDLRFRARNLTQEYESIIAESPEDLMPYLLYGKFLNRIGQQEHAVRMFLKADEIDRGVAVVKQQIGNYLAEMGKFEEALGFFIQAILLSPETALYHYQMAELLSVYKESFIEERVYFRDVLEYEMMKSFSQAVQLDPKNQDFKMRYAESIYDLEKPDWELALSLWEELQESARTSLMREAASLHRAKVISKLDRTEEAKSLAEAVTDPALINSRDELLAEIQAMAKDKPKEVVVK